MPLRDDAHHNHLYFIDSLRALSCFMVIWHHTLGYIDSPIGYYYTENMKMYFPTVPVFLVVSAFVYAHSLDRGVVSYRCYILKRAKRILVPYFLISAVTMFFYIVIERTEIIHLSKVFYTPFVFSDAVINLLFSGVADHYYFLEIVFVYLAIYPLLFKYFHGKKASFVILFAYVAVYQVINPFYLELIREINSPIVRIVSMLLWGMKYFLFGLFLYCCRDLYLKKFHDYGHLYGFGLLLLYGFLMGTFPECHSYFIFILLIAYTAISMKISKKPVPVVMLLSSVSYGVYIFHQPYFIKMFVMLVGSSYPSSLRVVLVWVLSCITASLFVYFAQKFYLFNQLFLGVKK